MKKSQGAADDKKSYKTKSPFKIKRFLSGLPPLFLSANDCAFRGTVLEPPHFVVGSQATVPPRRSLRHLLQSTAKNHVNDKLLLIHKTLIDAFLILE
ncbi:hypothetical protein [Bacillus sp. RO1]|uniref:hypothetical protein n=1 Tax=Bacillus sp. RO1 TaxID=2722703 RepID=UPI001456FAA6|nr:hypothetical protein [Bacillus sp. RO1]NLP49387.1 hypothetical protein [Bacillus sp. RO1]